MTSFRRRVAGSINFALRPLGLELHSRWRLPQLAQVEFMRRVFSEWGITGVIDAGANAGQFFHFVRNEVGFSGPVLSIEPLPELARGLRSRATPNWKIEEAAVGRTEGRETLQVTAGSEFSSLRTPHTDYRELFDGQSSTVATISVRTVTLDALLRIHSAWLGNRIYLKLDTQGYDLEALAGLDQYMSNIAASQCEAAFIPIYQDAPLIDETISAFRDRGLTLSSVFPNNAGHFPRLIEVDCFFVKEEMRQSA